MPVVRWDVKCSPTLLSMCPVAWSVSIDAWPLPERRHLLGATRPRRAGARRAEDRRVVAHRALERLELEQPPVARSELGELGSRRVRVLRLDRGEEARGGDPH